MTALVGWELMLLIVSGVVLGTTLGIGVSRLYSSLIYRLGQPACQLSPALCGGDCLGCGVAGVCVVCDAVYCGFGEFGAVGDAHEDFYGD